MGDQVGQRLGNYQLTRLLGAGGFAQVYLGEHIYLGTQAAIKVLDTQLTSDTVEWFLTEARTIARLVHPHIVRVLDFGVENLIPFLVLDYAPNGSLRQHHSEGQPLPLPTLVACFTVRARRKVDPPRREARKYVAGKTQRGPAQRLRAGAYSPEYPFTELGECGWHVVLYGT